MGSPASPLDSIKGLIEECGKSISSLFDSPSTTQEHKTQTIYQSYSFSAQWSFEIRTPIEQIRVIDADKFVHVQEDGKIAIRNIGTGKIIHLMDGHKSRFVRIKYISQMIISSGADKTIHIWNVSGKCIRTFKDFTSSVHHFAISERLLYTIAERTTNLYRELEVRNIDTGDLVLRTNPLYFGPKEIDLNKMRINPNNNTMYLFTHQSLLIINLNNIEDYKHTDGNPQSVKIYLLNNIEWFTLYESEIILSLIENDSELLMNFPVIEVITPKNGNLKDITKQTYHFVNHSYFTYQVLRKTKDGQIIAYRTKHDVFIINRLDNTTKKFHNNFEIYDIKVGHNGTIAVAGQTSIHKENIIEIYDYNTELLLYRLVGLEKGKKGKIQSLKYHSEKNTVIVGCENGYIHCFKIPER